MAKAKNYPGYHVIESREFSELLKTVAAEGLPFDHKYSSIATGLGKMLTWGEFSPHRTSHIFINGDIIEALDSSSLGDLRIRAMEMFSPPVGDLTPADYVKWTEHRIANKSASVHQSGIFGSNRRSPDLWFCGAVPHYTYDYINWCSDIIVSRYLPSQIYSAAGKPNNDGVRGAILDLLDHDFKPWGNDRAFAQEGILFYEWLVGSAHDVDLPLHQWLAEYEVQSNDGDGSWTELHQQVEAYRMVDYGAGTTLDLIKFVRAFLSGAFYGGKSKAVRELILSQDRPTLKRMIEIHHQIKGSTSKAVEEFVERCKRDIGAADAADAVSGKDIVRTFTTLLYELAARSPHSPDKTKILVVHSLQGLIASAQFEAQALVYGEMVDLLSEEGVRDELDVEDYAGFLFATYNNSAWLKGSSADAPYTMLEVLKNAGAVKGVRGIGRAVLKLEGSIPSIREWKEGSQNLDFDMMPEILFKLMSLNHTSTPRPMSKQLKDWRQSIKYSK